MIHELYIYMWSGMTESLGPEIEADADGNALTGSPKLCF